MLLLLLLSSEVLHWRALRSTTQSLLLHLWMLRLRLLLPQMLWQGLQGVLLEHRLWLMGLLMLMLHHQLLRLRLRLRLRLLLRLVSI